MASAKSCDAFDVSADDAAAAGFSRDSSRVRRELLGVAAEEKRGAARCGVDGACGDSVEDASPVADVARAEVSTVSFEAAAGVGNGSLGACFRPIADVTGAVCVVGAGAVSQMRSGESDDVDAQTARGSVTRAATSSATGRRFVADGPALWRSSASRARWCSRGKTGVDEDRSISWSEVRSQRSSAHEVQLFKWRSVDARSEGPSRPSNIASTSAARSHMAPLTSPSA
jgi:hypothetical protein